MNSSSDFLSFAVLIGAINLIILYFIIRGATRANEKMRMQRAIFGILCQIAKAQGVPDEKINEVVNNAYKF